MPREITRSLRDDERVALKRRRQELHAALRPHRENETVVVKTQVAAMLASFRQVRQTGSEIEAAVIQVSAALRGFPLWAVAKACILIGHGEAGLDPRFPPNDAEVRVVAKRVVWPYRDALTKVEALLAAPVEKPAPTRLTPEQIAAKLGRPFANKSPAKEAVDPPSVSEGGRG